MSARSRVLYLSQLFDPEPTFKGHDFIEDLEHNGCDVEVVTGFPNYPGGTVYDGYRIKMLQRDRINNTDVTRLAVYPSHDRSALKRILCYSSFMLTSFFYMVFRAPRADLVYVYYPALTAGLAAVGAKFFRRTPVILDVQDMWPDSLGSSGMMQNRVLLKVANAACNLVYRYCDHILVLSPGFKALLVDRGVPADKITVVYNWADETPAAATTPEVFTGTQDGLRVLFAGNMGPAQDLDVVLEAAKILSDKNLQCTFYLMGNGIDRDRLQQRAQSLGLANVQFLPRVPLKDVQSFLSAADALLVHLKDDPLFRITIPSKTQAYLYAGRPLLMGVPGDASDLVQRADAGYTFLPSDAEGLAQSVEQLMSDGAQRRQQMGQNAHEFYRDVLSRRNGIGATLHLINRFKRGALVDGPVKGDLS